MLKEKKLKITSSSPIITAAILVCLCLIFTSINRTFLSATNMLSILLNSVMVGIIAIGECVCIMSGYFDMSVGMVAAIGGLVAAYIMQATASAFLAVSGGLIIGLICGLLAGFLVSYLDMNAFITTFALQSVYRGVIYIMTDGFSVPLFNEEYACFTKWGHLRIAGIQFPIIAMLVLYVLFALFLKYRSLGRYIYLCGSNQKCAYICGISLHKVQMFVFVVCDMLAAFAGMLYASRLSTANAFLADTIGMEAIAATIIGGTSLAGGKGNLAFTFVGVLIVYVLKNGLVMIGLPDFYQYIAIGLVLFLAVLIQVERKRD